MQAAISSVMLRAKKPVLLHLLCPAVIIRVYQVVIVDVPVTVTRTVVGIVKEQQVKF